MIYADFNGSALPHPEVVAHLQNRLSEGPFANPNAIHCLGQQINSAIEKCRRVCAKALGAKPEQIIFNSGASEGISAVFFSLLHCKEQKKKTIITSKIEHAAVLNAAKFYEGQGYNIEYVGVDSNGVVDLRELRKIIMSNKDDIALVSIMAANNETGVIQPYNEISKICQENEIIFFSDTTQFIGKTEFNFEDSNLDYAVISGHKVGALIGSGILLAKNPETLRPHIFGGGQEKGHRGGTQNYLGIETLAVALKAFDENKDRLEWCHKNREAFEAKLKKEFPSIVIIGEQTPRLSSTTLVSYPGIHGQGVQIELEAQDIYVTTSSACSDNEPSTSKVLKAMGIDDTVGRGVVRISLCLGQNDNTYDQIFDSIASAYKKLGKIESY